MLALIFANGVLDPSVLLQPLLDQADIIIAADGGANHCAQYGIIPDILLGDFDSIDSSLLSAYGEENVEIQRHPVRKDATDLELALHQAKKRGADTVWLLGALGGRWDMSLANLLLAAGEQYKDLKMSILDKNCAMHILHPGKVHQLTGEAGKKVSLLPLQGDVQGVTLTGVEYPLTAHTIEFGSSLGISNVLQCNQATVKFTRGVLLCIMLFDE